LDISDTQSLPRKYKKCIEEIIEAMRKDSVKVFTFKDDGVVKCSVPVTAGPDNSPDGAYVIELTDGKRRLLLVATKYHTWFRGIVTDNDEKYEIDVSQKKKKYEIDVSQKKKKYEIDQPTRQMMAGSKPLHTDAVYCKLLGDGKTVDNCKIGIKSLKDSFKALVEHHDGHNETDYRTAIAVLLVMFFEAPRFVLVYETCLRLLKEKRDEFVGKDAKDLINGWSAVCGDFFKEHGDQMTVTLSNKTRDPVKKVADSVRILCWSEWDAWRKENSEDTSKPRNWDRRANARGSS
jgi:hypothetical protein